MESKQEEGKSTTKPNAYLILNKQIFPLTFSVTMIGRRLTNHLVIDDRRVSRSHAQIRMINNQYFLVDMNSTGGTFVNGQKIQQTILFANDQISFSGVLLSFVQDSIELENDSEDYTLPNIPIIKQDSVTEPRRARN